MKNGLYLIYCIFESGGNFPSLLPSGIDGQPVCLVGDNGLSAAVSRVSGSSGIRPDLPRVLAYENVVETFHRDRTVLPMRYGCLLEGESQVIELLWKHCEEYRSLLRDLTGCVELGIRILLPIDRPDSPACAAEHRLSAVSAQAGDPPAAARAGAAGRRLWTADSGLREDTPGRAYLEARRADCAVKERWALEEAEVAESCQTAFAGLFVKCKTECLRIAHSAFRAPLLSLYFLVKRESEESFCQAFRALSRRESARMMLSGPWPPYNFVPLERQRE